jgi:hypothetical protein
MDEEDKEVNDAFIEFYSDYFYKFFISLVRSKDYSQEFYSKRLELQKMSEKEMVIIAKIAAEIFVDKLISEGYRENIPEEFAEREIPNSIELAINQYRRE